jgi:hypothetical protein
MPDEDAMHISLVLEDGLLAPAQAAVGTLGRQPTGLAAGAAPKVSGMLAWR